MIRQKAPVANRSPSRPVRIGEPPTLRLSPTAWAKLLFLRDMGDTEVGGFGISAADDLLYVEDVQLVRQACTAVSIALDDQAVADFFDRQIDLGQPPKRFGRIWLHTHPGNCALPSSVDEGTFSRVFGRTDWAVMLIVARDGQSYARLRFHVGPGGDVDLPVCVDYSHPFAASNHAAWQEEYEASVQIADASSLESHGILASLAASPDPWEDDWLSDWQRLFEEEDANFAEAQVKESCHAV